MLTIVFVLGLYGIWAVKNSKQGTQLPNHGVWFDDDDDDHNLVGESFEEIARKIWKMNRLSKTGYAIFISMLIFAFYLFGIFM